MGLALTHTVGVTLIMQCLVTRTEPVKRILPALVERGGGGWGPGLEMAVPRHVLTISPVLLIGSRKMPESQGQLNRVMVKEPKDEAMIYPASK